MGVSMEKLFEKAMKLDTAEAFDQILKTQTKTYGVYEINRLAKLIQENDVKSVLDIGTGEGSFLLTLAKGLKGVRFTGIDHNNDFLKKALKLKDEMELKNVRFLNNFFDSNYDLTPHDLILTRFTLQHASAPQQFLDEVYKRLNDGGLFVTIDEYLFVTEIQDEVWNEFYSCWIRCFKEAGCNHLMSKEINPWLSNAGFKEVENTIQLYSPVTIGTAHFKLLVTRIAVLLNKVYPNIWDKSFLSKFEGWLDKITKTKSIDPFVPVAHVIARK